LGGKKQDNSQMVNEQKKQATEARQKEADRQARIDKGLAAINAAFEGSPVTATRSTTKTFDYNNAVADKNAKVGGQVSGLPAGYTYVQEAGTSGGGGTGKTQQAAQSYSGGGSGHGGASGGATYSQTGTGRAGDQGSFSYTGGGGGTAGTSGGYAIRGPDGKIYRKGDKINYTGDEQYDTGKKSGGFDDSFYNKFKQSILDYYMPQVEDQYAKAKDQTTYGLARAGTLQSSAATDETARLAKENTTNRATVASKADESAAALKQRVAQEKAKAVSTLYSTEDPDVATNQALSAVKDVSVAKADLSPLGQVFQTALIGGANAYTGARNQNQINEYKKKLAASKVVS